MRKSRACYGQSMAEPETIYAELKRYVRWSEDDDAKLRALG